MIPIQHFCAHCVPLRARLYPCTRSARVSATTAAAAAAVVAPLCTTEEILYLRARHTSERPIIYTERKRFFFLLPTAALYNVYIYAIKCKPERASRVVIKKSKTARAVPSKCTTCASAHGNRVASELMRVR